MEWWGVVSWTRADAADTGVSGVLGLGGWRGGGISGDEALGSGGVHGLEGLRDTLAGEETNAEGEDIGETSTEAFVEGEECEVILEEADFGVWIEGAGFLVG